MERRLVRVSKYLSKYLRHAPEELGLTLRHHFGERAAAVVLEVPFLGHDVGEEPVDGPGKPSALSLQTEFPPPVLRHIADARRKET